MPLYYSKQKVKDFDTWLPFVEADKGGIHSTGAKAVSMMRSVHDPNEVHFVYEVHDAYAFMTLIESPGFAEVMRESGAIDKPVLYKMEEV